MIGSHGHNYANRAVAEADVIVFIGARLGDRATGENKLFKNNPDIIHIDIDPAEIGKNLGTSIPIVGDAKNVLNQLLELVRPLKTEDWIDYLTNLKETTKS